MLRIFFIIYNFYEILSSNQSIYDEKVLPATKMPGKPGILDTVSITYNGISISGELILFLRNGSQLWYLLYIANPEKQVVIERSDRIGHDSHIAFCEAFIFLKQNVS